MSLNNKNIVYHKPKLSAKGNEIVTRLEQLYGEDKITRDDLLLIAENLLERGNFFTRKQYQDFTGKSPKAHYFKQQVKLLGDIDLIIF